MKNIVPITMVGVALFSPAGIAWADAVTSITVTGGDFGMNSPGTSNGPCGSGGVFGASQCITAGSNPTLAAGSTSSPASITAFDFYNVPVTTFLAPSAAGAVYARDWGSGFSGSTSGATITLNLGGFYANWNGTNFLAGTDSTGAFGTSTAATGSISNCNNNVCSFDVSWQSYVTTAPFPGSTSYWHLTGTVTTVVPIPSAVWLLGSGLFGLIGLARRRGTTHSHIDIPAR